MLEFRRSAFEPTWMIIGQSAGIIAALASKEKQDLHELPYAKIRTRLLAQGQILDLPKLGESCVHRWLRVGRMIPRHCQGSCLMTAREAHWGLGTVHKFQTACGPGLCPTIKNGGMEKRRRRSALQRPKGAATKSSWHIRPTRLARTGAARDFERHELGKNSCRSDAAAARRPNVSPSGCDRTRGRRRVGHHDHQSRY